MGSAACAQSVSAAHRASVADSGAWFNENRFTPLVPLK